MLHIFTVYFLHYLKLYINNYKKTKLVLDFISSYLHFMMPYSVSKEMNENNFKIIFKKQCILRYKTCDKVLTPTFG